MNEANPSYRKFSFKMLAGVMLVVAAGFTFAIVGSVKQALDIHRNILGNGFRAVCPKPDSDVYRLAFMPKDGYDFETWARMIWRGPNSSPRDVAFSIQAIPSDREAQATQSEAGPKRTVQGIDFQVAETEHGVVVLMTLNGRRSSLSGFQIHEIDVTSFQTAAQVTQILGAVADIIWHCSAKSGPA